jgi:hypothetical protein
MAIKDGGVAGANLTRVVENDDLSIEGSGFLSGVVLRVRGNISTTNILDRDVPAKEVRYVVILLTFTLRT